MKRLLVFIALILTTSLVHAQINEIGITVAGSNYIGDIGSEYYINPNNLAFGGVYKRNINSRIALRGNLNIIELSANDADATNRQRYFRGIRFNNTLKEVAVGIEYNYFNYDISNFKYSYTPYILVQIAAINYKIAEREIAPNQFEYGNKTSIAIPFGLGIKTKLAQDFAIALEVSARYTFEDDLDYNNNAITSLTFGNPNSNDWYVLSGLSLVYTFGRPPCYAPRF